MLAGLKIWQKSILPVVLLSGVMIGLGTFMGGKLNEIDDSYTTLLEHKVQGTLWASRSMTWMVDMGRASYRSALDEDKVRQAATIDTIIPLSRGMLERSANARAAFVDPTLLRLNEEATVEMKLAADAVQDVVARLKANDRAGATNLMFSNYAPHLTKAREINQKLLDTAFAQLADATVALKAEALAARRNSYIAMAASVLFALIIGVWISVSGIVRPFGVLNRSMVRIGEGELTETVEGLDRKDEIGAMARTLEVFKTQGIKNREMQAEALRMREAESERERLDAEAEKQRLLLQSEAERESAEKLRVLGHQIYESVEAIHVATDEISAGSTDLAERTEKEASALQEVLSVVVQVTAAVTNNTRIAEDARQMSTNAATVADKGKRVVAEVIDSIKAIEDSSRRISAIIVVMEEIAFQTKLLALNAAVEAARAGDSGRGFAVVAKEVRNLADRSRQASQQIRELIGDSTVQVNEGVERASSAESALEDIVGSVRKVADIVPEIAASGREQARGMEEVERAMTELDQATQANAALVEESSAAVNSLAEQANSLASLVVALRGADSSMTDVQRPKPAPSKPGSVKARKPVPANTPIKSRPVIDRDWQRP